MSELSDRRGEFSECIARIACDRLKAQGAIANYLAIDTHGIDLLIITPHGQAMPLQVKSSWAEVRKHRDRHPHIPTVTIRYRSIRKGRRRTKRLVKIAEARILRLLASRKYAISLFLFVLVFCRRSV